MKLSLLFEVSRREIKRAGRSGKLGPLPEDAKVVVSQGPYDIVEITSPDASGILCTGSKWCIANKQSAIDYLKDGRLFVVYRNKQRYAAFFIGSDGDNSEFMDVNNRPLDFGETIGLIDLLEPVTGLGLEDFPDFLLDLLVSDEDYSDILISFKDLLEPLIIRSPRLATFWAVKVLKKRWPEAEPYLKRDLLWYQNYLDKLS